jgi:hypothetical protein
MAKRNKKATRKIERLRDRLHHVDENPDFKVGWLTQYMFVMDNFDIGETKRANENRWLYTIGPQRRTRYPFETMVIPGTHYTLHWFMQCKISDPSQVPEFKYVPISTGASSLPFGTAPYVPTVQISQTKSDWSVVCQDSYITDAKVILQGLAKCLNQHNFTIFDARDLMPTLSLKLPLISHEETICELEFLERQRKGIVVAYQNRQKRKFSSGNFDYSPNKRLRLDSGSSSTTSATTQSLLDLLSYGPVTLTQAAQQLQVKEKLVEQIVDVLAVVGSVSFANGVISSSALTPESPTGLCPASPSTSTDESYGPIPETPPQSMPMWDSGKSESSEPLSPRPYATRSASRRVPSSFMDTEDGDHKVAPGLPLNPPPPTQPAQRFNVKEEEREWAPILDIGGFSVGSHTDKFTGHKTSSNEMTFESNLNLDLGESTIMDFFQSSFWDQY